MKKYFLMLLLCVLPQSPIPLLGGLAAPGAANQGAMGLPGMSKEEEEYMLAMLEGLSPEELDELAKIGEQTMKNLDRKGISIEQALTDPSVWEDPELWDDIDFGNFIETESTPSAKPAKPAEPVIEEEEKKDEPKKEEVILSFSDKEKLQAIKNKLSDIAEKIVSLKQKAETKRSLQELIKPFELALSDLLYFVLTIKEDHLLKYFLDKKFEPLQQLINELHEILEIYEPQVYVTEFSLEGEDPYTILEVSPTAPFETIYKKYQQLVKAQTALPAAQQNLDAIVWAFEALQAKENSKQALELILNVVQNALHGHDFLNKIKEFVKAYDPDALKIKEAQEQTEKKAREEQERMARQRAPWLPPVAAPAGKRASYDAPFYTGATFPKSTPSSSSKEPKGSGGTESTSAPKEGGGKKSGGKKDGKEEKKEDKKSDEKKDKKDEKKKKDDKKPGLDRDVLRIEDKLETLQETLANESEQLSSLKEYLGTEFADADKSKALTINTALADITKQVDALEKRINKDLDKLKDDKKKDNKAKKKTYTEGVKKAYEKFAKDEKTKKALATIQELSTNEGGILVNNEPFTTDKTKRFLVTGAAARDLSVTDDLKRINNPALIAEGGAEGEEVPAAIDYIKNIRESVTKFEKFMKDSFTKK